MIPGEQRQVVLLDGESLEDFNKLSYLGLVFVVYIAVYKGQGLPGSGALHFALRLRDTAFTNSRRKDIGGLCQ